MHWLAPELVPAPERPRWPVLLSVCPNLDRLQRRERALVSAGYHVVSASTLIAAWGMSQLCKFDLVLLDDECVAGGESVSLQERCATVLLPPSASDKDVIAELVKVLTTVPSSIAIH
jgi:hypothetical protein